MCPDERLLSDRVEPLRRLASTTHGADELLAFVCVCVCSVVWFSSIMFVVFVFDLRLF